MTIDENPLDIPKVKTRPAVGKISFVGSPAVGKTTLMKLLTQKNIEKKYNPTQGFDLGTLDFEGFKLKIWDFGGQKAYLKHYMSQYIEGSDIVFIVTDSSPKNVLSTKELVSHTKNLFPDDCAKIVALANKQDLDGHLNPKMVKDVLQVPTYGITAINQEQRRILVEIINVIMEEIEKEKGA
ncbi:MAG: GTP-binding protein [Candidatus Lokiarchaeota archaeon]|nr:GTP-binding protein [Candidatus Lokiarchaeota archaeon]